MHDSPSTRSQMEFPSSERQRGRLRFFTLYSDWNQFQTCFLKHIMNVMNYWILIIIDKITEKILENYFFFYYNMKQRAKSELLLFTERVLSKVIKYSFSSFLFFFCEFSHLFHDPIKSSWAIYKAHMNHVRRYIFCVFTRIDVFEYLFIERDEKKIDHLQKGKFFLWGKQEVYPYLREKKRRNDLFSTFLKIFTEEKKRNWRYASWK